MTLARLPLLIIAAAILIASPLKGIVSDPELDFIRTPDDVAAEYGIIKKDEIIRLELELTGDGKPTVFLTYKGTGSRGGMNWSAYVPVEGGYQRTNGVQFREDFIRAGKVDDLNPAGGLLSLMPGKSGGILYRDKVNETGGLISGELMRIDYSNPDHQKLFERVFGRKLDEPMPDEFFKNPPHQVIDVKSIEARAASKPKIGTAEPASTETAPAPKPLPVVQPTAPKKASTTSPTTAPSEEPTSSTAWSIIVVLIVAAGGLLWWLGKRRS